MLEAGYFERKRRELGLDRAEVLAEIQGTLETWYPGQTRARQLHQGVLKIVTSSAAVASELRLRQMELLARYGQTGMTAYPVERLQISIGSLQD